jgi:chaperonin GroES
MALPESNLIEFVLQDSMDIFEPIPEFGFYDNLCGGFLSEEDVERIGSMVMDSYEADKESRSEWESMFEKGFELLGLKLNTTSEPFQGACTAVHPLLIESAVKFQSKASEELFPPQGPVKTQIIGVPSAEKEEQSYRVQTFMNYQLTEVMPEYFDEFERMLFHLPLVGSAFKKIYYDPASDRPVSEFVPVDQFYVSYNATDLRRADRYTHIIYMTPHELQKQMMSGMYRDVDLSDPGAFQPSSMSQTINSIMGIEFNAEYDKQYTLLEQHLYLELDGDDFPSPYIVTIEKDSGKVLSIRRNWNEGDPTREKKMFFTHYKYVPGFGFYGLGLIHFLGNLTMSATLAMRSLLDAGQFANLPGGFKARGIRIVGGDDPIAPGEFREVEATGMDLNKAIVPLPYKEPSQTLYQLLGFITQAGQKFADSTDAVVADSTNYGPVGTTLALIEASAKLFSAIHKRLHKSQKDELRILARLNYEFLPDERMVLPIPGMDLPIFRSDFDGRVDIIPVSDPNIPSQAHRLAQAQMLLQISAQTPPGTYNMREVHRSLLSAAGITDPNRFLSPEKQPQPQDPVSDVIAASKGMPIAAFPGQDHQAYITVFSSFLQDPTLGQNTALQSIGPLLQAAIRDHMMMQYQETMGGFLQGATPDVMPEIMAEAAQQILNANQQLGQYQSLEQQQVMLETKSLELREKDMAQSNAKDIAELSLKKQELDIRKRGQDIEAARDIGANTIRSKEADNKKDIMLQKFLLEGLGKMQDINLKNTSSGTSPGYKGGGATEIKGYEPGGMVSFDDIISLINSYENGGTAALFPQRGLIQPVGDLPPSPLLAAKLSPVYGKWLDDTQAYIGEAENASRILTGHIPKKDGIVMGDSGVTFSTGLDLGKQTEESLRNMGLDEDLILKLSPFLGKTGQDALDLLKDQNITLTVPEYDQIDRKLLEFEFNDLRNQWDSGSIRGMDPEGTTRWFDLSPAQRTVIQSVLRQYGKSGAPTFIGHASRADWGNVINELDNFVNPASGHEQYLSRREKDSNLLREELGLELVDLVGRDIPPIPAVKPTAPLLPVPEAADGKS